MSSPKITTCRAPSMIWRARVPFAAKPTKITLDSGRAEIVPQMMANPPARAHARAGEMTAPPEMELSAMESAVSRQKCRPGRPNGSMRAANSRAVFRPIALGMCAENLRGGDRHGRIEKDLHGGRPIVLLDALAQEEQHLLRALQREGRDDDIAAALERLVERQVEFLQRRRERTMQTVAIGRLHDRDIDIVAAGPGSRSRAPP